MNRGEDELKQQQQRLNELREKTHRKLDYHLQQSYVGANDFYQLIAGFFLELLERKYQPTYEEIIEELDTLQHEYLKFTPQQREQVRQLLSQLSHHEYTPGEMDQETAKRLLADFKVLITDLTALRGESIDMFLQQGFIAIKKENKKQALTFYTQAYKKYVSLPPREQQQYHGQLSKLYNALKA